MYVVVVIYTVCAQVHCCTGCTVGIVQYVCTVCVHRVSTTVSVYQGV